MQKHSKNSNPMCFLSKVSLSPTIASTIGLLVHVFILRRFELFDTNISHSLFFRMLRLSFVVYLGCRQWLVCLSPLSGQCYRHTTGITQKYVTYVYVHTCSQIHITHIQVRKFNVWRATWLNYYKNSVKNINGTHLLVGSWKLVTCCFCYL